MIVPWLSVPEHESEMTIGRCDCICSDGITRQPGELTSARCIFSSECSRAGIAIVLPAQMRRSNMPAGTASKKTIFRSARIFDGSSDQLLEGMDVIVVNGMVEDLSPRQTEIDAATEVVDCAGRTLMPGLIDAHVHGVS